MSQQTKLDPKEIEDLFNRMRPEFEAWEKEKEMRRKAEAARRNKRVAKPKRGVDVTPKHTYVAGISARVRHGMFRDDALVTRKEGKTRIQKESLRAQLLKALERKSKTVHELEKQLGFDPRPVLGKLREAGWVEVK